MNAINRKRFTRRLLEGVDLAIDFATLGEYGLEPLSEAARGDADEHCRERPGRTAGWEALAEGLFARCVRRPHPGAIASRAAAARVALELAPQPTDPMGV